MNRDQLMRTATDWIAVRNSPLLMERHLFWGPERSEVVARVQKLLWLDDPPKPRPANPNVKGAATFHGVLTDARHSFDGGLHDPFVSDDYYLSLTVTPDDPDAKPPRFNQTCTIRGFTLETTERDPETNDLVPFNGTVAWETFNSPRFDGRYEPEHRTYLATAGVGSKHKQRFVAAEPDTPTNEFPTARKAMDWVDKQLTQLGYLVGDGHCHPEMLSQIQQRQARGRGDAWPRWRTWGGN